MTTIRHYFCSVGRRISARLHGASKDSAKGGFLVASCVGIGLALFPEAFAEISPVRPPCPHRITSPWWSLGGIGTVCALVVALSCIVARRYRIGLFLLLVGVGAVVFRSLFFTNFCDCPPLD